MGILDLDEQQVRNLRADERVTDKRTLGCKMTPEQRKELFVAYEELVADGRMQVFQDYLDTLQPGELEQQNLLEQVLMLMVARMNKVAFVHRGGGNNGKSSYFELAKMLLGDYLYIGHERCMGGKMDGPTMVAMSGCRGTLYDDVFGKKSTVSDARLKMLVANKNYNSRGNWQNDTEQENYATSVFLWNKDPPFTFVDPAVATRLCVQDWRSKFVNPGDPLQPALSVEDRVFKKEPRFTTDEFYKEYSSCLLILCVRRFSALRDAQFEVVRSPEMEASRVALCSSNNAVEFEVTLSTIWGRLVQPGGRKDWVSCQDIRDKAMALGWVGKELKIRNFVRSDASGLESLYRDKKMVNLKNIRGVLLEHKLVEDDEESEESSEFEYESDEKDTEKVDETAAVTESVGDESEATTSLCGNKRRLENSVGLMGEEPSPKKQRTK